LIQSLSFAAARKAGLDTKHEFSRSLRNREELDEGHGFSRATLGDNR
jgi:hypothetical protein